MNDERYWFLMNNENENLTQEEIESGYHFCPCWDDLLVGPDMVEFKYCYCENKISQDGS